MIVVVDVACRFGLAMIAVDDVEFPQLLHHVFLACLMPFSSLLDACCYWGVDGSAVDYLLSIWRGRVDGLISVMCRALSLSEQRSWHQLALCSSLGAMLRHKL